MLGALPSHRWLGYCRGTAAVQREVLTSSREPFHNTGEPFQNLRERKNRSREPLPNFRETGNNSREGRNNVGEPPNNLRETVNNVREALPNVGETLPKGRENPPNARETPHNGRETPSPPETRANRQVSPASSIRLLLHRLEQLADDLRRLLARAGRAVVGDDAVLQDRERDGAHVGGLGGDAAL